MLKQILKSVVLIAANVAVAHAASAADSGQAIANLVDRDGNSVGTVTMMQEEQGVLLTAHLNSLPPGTHAFHIHETGVCQGDFKSAGGHFAPGGNKHGIASEGGMHAGDMPNVYVPDSGKLDFDVFNTRVSLDETLFDNDGAAIVIHEGADDYETDPAGDAGQRIACGVIEE
jgi:Cu-Zn family superoxide dismutase